MKKVSVRTTPSDKDLVAMREAFEKWFENNLASYPNPEWFARHDNDYDIDVIQNCWLGWQGSAQHQATELKQLRAELEKYRWKSVKDEPPPIVESGEMPKLELTNGYWFSVGYRYPDKFKDPTFFEEMHPTYWRDFTFNEENLTDSAQIIKEGE